jgi:hypothetical protein
MYKVAYEEGKRLVDDQLAELDGMRQRSVQFLAFIGSATAFLVGTSLGRVSQVGVAYEIVPLLLAGAASAASLIAIYLVVTMLLALSKDERLKPTNWRFRLSPEVLIRWIEPEVPQPDEVDFLRNLADVYQKMYEYNEPRLKRLRKFYTAFVAIGFFQLVLWASVAWING